MPELPDVETFKRYFNATSLHKKIEKVMVEDDDILEGISQRGLKLKLKNRKLERSRRHGKYLFAELDNNYYLIMHFGMTGFLSYARSKEYLGNNPRVILKFSDGYYLSYDCQRKLGKVSVINDLDDFIRQKELGPDALDSEISFEEFKRKYSSRSGSIKSAMMNQSILSGIGNVYSDEILFQASIHPASSAKKLSEKELKKLHSTMKRVLNIAIKRQADPGSFPRTYLLRHRTDKEKCPKCGGTIRKKTISGRSSLFCSKHQRKF
ncbi:MAG: Fpg/Nei family DNA glycosylase [candidate division Zixibacteria bacterium]|nr:Fpg/Nei family DNA glycosylase [candidate division Zixibacteria bacterium]